MPSRRLLLLTVVLATAGALVVAGSGMAAVPAWTTYRHDAARTGIDPDSGRPVKPAQAWQTRALDGQVYAQPLIYGSHVYVATENDTIYELAAGTGNIVWSKHLATPETSSDAVCGDIFPTVGITSTPVVDPATNRIYAVGAVFRSGVLSHKLFALNLSTGRPIPGFPIAVDPPYPSGGKAINQLQRAALALDHGRILIGYGGNNGDCATYWGWLVSAPATGTGAPHSFQVDPDHNAGAIWGAGNGPTVDGAGNVFVATGNGMNNSTSNPEYGDAVVKLNPLSSVLDWWAPSNWQTLDYSDLDLGSGMPTLLPGGYLFQAGKDGSGYLLNGAALGHVAPPAGYISSFCPAGSWGGSVYDPANLTVFTACRSGLSAAVLGSGHPPTITAKPNFSAPSNAQGPPMIAGGLVWVTDHSSGTLFGLDPATGTAKSDLAIPEEGSQVNHFASPSAGGGRLFVGSGDQVTAYTIALAPPKSRTSTRLRSSANPARVGAPVTLIATVAPAPDSGIVTFRKGTASLGGCSSVPISAVTGGRAVCHTTFGRAGTHRLTATYSGDAFYTTSASGVLTQSVLR